MLQVKNRRQVRMDGCTEEPGFPEAVINAFTLATGSLESDQRPCLSTDTSLYCFRASCLAKRSRAGSNARAAPRHPLSETIDLSARDSTPG